MSIGKYYRINQNITAREVRLLDQEGKQIGIVSLEEALKRARNDSLDLVEIAGQAKPPVVKVINFKKFKYIEARKEREVRKKTKEIDTKEIWMKPLISAHDLEIRISRAKHFLQTGDRVKLTIKFAGRQITHPELGHRIINESLKELSDFGEKDSEPKMIGRSLSINIKPVRK